MPTTRGADDDDLARRFAQGDDRALCEAWKRWSGLVHGAAQRSVGPDAAADLTRKVFVRAWRSREQLLAHGSLAAWLVGITWAEGCGVPGPRSAHRSTRLDGPVADRGAVVGYLTGLRDPQLGVVRLVLLDGLSYEQTAGRLRIPRSTVQRHARDALRQLRAIVREDRAGRDTEHHLSG